MANINIKITGKVDLEDWQDSSRKYDLIVAKLKVICAEYGLDLDESYTPEGF